MGNSQGTIPVSVQRKHYEDQEEDLFDFSQTLKANAQKFTIQNSGFIDQDDKGNFIYQLRDQPTDNSIMHVGYLAHNHVVLSCLQTKAKGSKVWIASSTQPTQISVGDQIKLGKYEFKIKKIQLEQESKSKSFMYRPSFLENNLILQNSRIPQCRLCFIPGSEGNQLVSPCLCSGSQQFIHLTCLRDWLGTKIQQRQSKFFSMLIAPPLTCQVCGGFFKKEYEFDDRKLPLLKSKTPKSPYVILEGCKNNQINTMTLAIKLVQQRQISIGRQTLNDVQISDISISRNHCFLYLAKDILYVADKQSKFGTLIRPFDMKSQRNVINLKYSNSLIELKGPFSLVNQCCMSNILNFKFKS